MRTAERGFTLIELVACVALILVAGAATVGAFAALARNANSGTARDAALMVAENALARARAAVAYAASPVQDGPALLNDRTWGLVAGETHYLAGAALRAGTCATNTPLQLPVTTNYDPAAERFSVTVVYPRDPCRVAADGTIPDDDAASVSLAETLPPSVYPPGQVVHHDVATPARM